MQQFEDLFVLLLRCYKLVIIFGHLFYNEVVLSIIHIYVNITAKIMYIIALLSEAIQVYLIVQFQCVGIQSLQYY